MQTLHLTDSREDLEHAASLLKNGELGAIPTETVYGLAANALNGEAVASIFRAKGRPSDNPLIVHIAHREELSGLVADVPSVAAKLADAYWPGPLTMIFRKAACIPLWLWFAPLRKAAPYFLQICGSFCRRSLRDRA